MIQNPIFIIGTERSGSNLLRLILNAHPHIAIPHPPHLMRDVSPILHLYGDLSDSNRFKILIGDVVEIVSHHFAPWPIEIDRESIFREAPSRSLYGIYVALYEQYRVHIGKRRWGCKSTFMYRHISEILAHHSEPRFLHLVRDPRDVAASAGRSVFSKFHPYKEAKLWAAEQGCIETWSHLRSQGTLLRIHYENLTKNPKAELIRIMNFLGENWTEEQLLYFNGSEAAFLSELMVSWKNVASPIQSTRAGRYKSELNMGEVSCVEAIAGELMVKYGYELTSQSGKSDLNFLQLVLIEMSERVRKIKAEIISMKEDRNFYLRWRKLLFIEWLKLRRGFGHSG